MPENKSYLTEVYEEALERMESMLENFTEAHPIPFMKEAMTNGEFQQRWKVGSDAWRSEAIKELGLAKVQELLGGNDATTPV